MVKMRSAKIISLNLVVSLFYLSIVQSIDLGKYLRDTRNQLVNVVRDGIINSSPSMIAFNETMHKIQRRYDEAVTRGELDGKDQAEQKSFYYKIVIEEIKTLKKDLVLEDEAKLDAKIEQLANNCKECSSDARESLTKNLSMEESDDESDIHIKNELDDAENMEKVLQLEAEMGWSIDPETKEAFKLRAMNLLSELVQNEVKSLVLIVIRAYFIDSTPPGAVAAVIGALNSGLRTKVGEFLMDTIVDIFKFLFKEKTPEAVLA